MNIDSNTIPNSQKVKITQMSINGRMDKQIVIHTYKRNTPGYLKRNEVPIHVTRWINMKNIMLSKEARHKKSHIM